MKRGILRLLFIVMGIGVLAGGAFLACAFLYFSATLPRLISVGDYHPPIVTQIVMREPGGERVVAELFKEHRYLIPIEKVPPVVIDAFVSAEDDQFFQHQGISWLSIIRAGIANFMAGHVVQGGSTITQQVVKSLFLSPERNIVRKVKEAILAGRIERNLTKQQILYLYLNQIYLGGGAHGLQAACKAYFHKDVAELTLPEAAILAGMPRAPGRCSPATNPRCAKDRQLYVLKRMKETGRITEDQMTQAIATPIRVYHPLDIDEKSVAFLVEHVRRYLVQKFGEKAVYEDGFRVEAPSTLENYQNAEASVKEGLRQVDKRRGYRGPAKHLTTPKEIGEFLAAQHESLLHKKVPFFILTRDGAADITEAEVQAGLKSDDQLITPGEVYEAIVTQVDDQKRAVHAKVATIDVTVPQIALAWIRSGKESKAGLLSKIFTPGDVILVRPQKAAVKGAVTAELEQDPLLQGALLSMEARTGYVMAMIGGYDYDKSEFNRAIQAQRQSGSAFKPVIYAAGLENGFTPASIIVDSPLVYSDDENGKWKPSNYEDKFYGDISFRQALIKSMNIPTIKIVQQIRVPTVINYARRLGLTADFSQDLSISLGSATFSLLELTQMYALFPRLGRKLIPIFIKRILSREGVVLEENTPKSLPEWVMNDSAVSPVIAMPAPSPSAAPSAAPMAGPTAAAAIAGNEPADLPGASAYPPPDDPDQVLDPRVAYVMTHLMKEVVEFGTGIHAKVLGRPIAGKTGTTNEYRDAWFIGYSPYIVTGTWVGFDDQQTLGSGETGSAAAIPIWLSYMKDATKNYPPDEFVTPRGIVFAWIDQKTGKLAPAGAEGAVREAFLEGTAPAAAVNRGGTDTQSDSEFLKEDLE